MMYTLYSKINHYICNLNITHLGYTHHTSKKIEKTILAMRTPLC